MLTLQGHYAYISHSRLQSNIHVQQILFVDNGPKHYFLKYLSHSSPPLLSPTLWLQAINCTPLCGASYCDGTLCHMLPFPTSLDLC